ncbi:MAG: DUF3426 domain-containing protein [Desulfobacterales bacterium]
MIITCEECDTSFNLDEKVVKPSGSKVRCSQCRHVFVAYPTSGVESDEAGLQLEPAAEGDAGPAQVGAEASDSSPAEALEAGGALAFDEEPEAGADRAFEEALEDLDLGDLSRLDLDADSTADNGDIDMAEIENLLELEDDDWASEKRPPAADAAAPLAANPTMESPTAAAGGEALDLDGLDDLFEVPAEAAGNDQREGLLEGAEAQKPAPAAAETGEDEIIDLSDLEEMLDFEEDRDALEPQEVELTLSEDFGAEEEMSAIDDGSFEEDELDLSDLGELLEEDEADAPAGADATTGDLQRAEAGAVDTDGDEVEMLDLSDLGGTLDDEGGDRSPAEARTAAGDEDLELELDFESPADEDRKTADDDFELEFETDDSQKDAGLAAAASAAVAAGGLAAAAAMDKPDGEQAASETVASGARPADREKAHQQKPYKGVERAQKRSGSALALILLLLILLAVGVLALQKFLGVNIPYVTDLTRNIPYIGEFVQPQGQVSDPAGNLHLSTLEINSRFIENDSAGRLFIITGQVKNGYTVARSHIQVTGKIYSQGKQLVKSENVFSGNILSDLDLKNLSFEDISNRLNTKDGSRMANVDVKPGATVPFMLVFSNLPENLEEFTIEVAGSSAVN